MARGVGPGGGPLPEYGLRRFRPGARQHGVGRARSRELAQRVLVGGAEAGRVNQEGFVVVLDDFRAFVHVGWAHVFPGVLRARKLHARPGEGPGVAHLRDVDALHRVDAIMTRPQEIAVAVLLQHRAVDGPKVGVGVKNSAFVHPRSRGGVGAGVFQHPGALQAQVGAVGPGGVVEVPLAVEEIQLRSPEVARGRAVGGRRPHHRVGGTAKRRHVRRFPNGQAVVQRVGVIIKTVFLGHEWVGAAGQ